MTVMTAEPPICHLDERDVDLLLLEELWVSSDFRAWLLERAGLDPSLTFERAERSVVTANGESDVEAAFRGPAGAVHLLIENKIGAAFQDRQGERYRERGEARIRRGECGAFRVILVAPEAYLDGALAGPHGSAFDAAVPYERIAAWLAETGTERGRFRARLLESVLAQRRNGRAYDAGITDFHASYWRVQRELAPRLEMKRPDVRGPRSHFLVFLPAALEQERVPEKWVELQHKLERGHVDLELRRRGQLRAEFLREFGSRLPDWVTVARAGKSLALRCAVPRIAVAGEFEPQRKAVEEAVVAAARLLDWALANPDVLDFGKGGGGSA